MSEEDGSDDSDEWGTADLPEPTTTTTEYDQAATPGAMAFNDHNDDNDDDDDGWANQLPPQRPTSPTTAKEVTAGEPMILVDMTILSQRKKMSEIHSRFDRNSVNDAEAVKRLRKTIENDYTAYAKHSEYLSERIVIPCGSSVWKDALPRLRDERPGHYFCPVFAPRRDGTS